MSRLGYRFSRKVKQVCIEAMEGLVKVWSGASWQVFGEKV